MSENALKLYYPPESLAKNAAVSGMGTDLPR